MPDAGDFEKDGASASPASWGDAFAALPQDAPDAGGWQRLQARLPVATPPRVRMRWPLWLATAASLGLVVALPLRISREAASDLPASTAVQAPGQDALAPHPGAGRDPATAAGYIRDEGPAQRVAASGRESTDGGQALASTVAAGSKPSAATRIAPAHRPVRTVAEPAGTTRLAESGAATHAIESLYAESAQLEQLLALVRDERVASGASAALSSELDDRVAGIDADLTQPGLDAADRDRLWRERVDAMQQLVGIETTRALSARGDTFNASLVSID
ncbi:MAG TPA: hypothetical protein VLC71_01480 [Thermomonas sp.]|nr:hypothetical protein [Thermomonas sp.]